LAVQYFLTVAIYKVTISGSAAGLPGALFELAVDPAEICSLVFKANGLGGACDMRWLLFPYFKTSSS
jgi:hypothetical protein